MIYQLRYLKLLAIFNAVVLKSLFLGSTVIAQNIPVPDDTLGSENSQVAPFNNNDLINIVTGGASRGSNLFHSFREFNVGVGKGVYFAVPSAEIQNILARVTGGSRSDILGTLGTFGGSQPNLFLINPNGIVFGEGASLDVGGSFVGTTANALQFGKRGVFSATEPAKSNLLAVNPSALFFNAVNNQAEIVNRSRARATVSGNSFNGNVNRPINGLQVLDGKSLLLVGGNVNLDGGQILSPSGRIELGSIAGIGSISFKQTEKGLVLGYENINKFGDIKLSRNALIDTSGIGGGSIQIQGYKLLADSGSIIGANTRGDKAGSDIFIRTKEAVTVDDSVIGTLVEANASGDGGNILIETKKLDVLGGISVINGLPFGGLISTGTLGQGEAGNVNIKAEKISLTNSGEISASTLGTGNAGNIEINASESIEVIGTLDSNNRLLSKISSQVRENASGKGGNILINTKRFTVKDGAQIQAGTFSEASIGKGGTLTVNAAESIEISGTNGGGSPSGLFTATYGGAEAGDLTINTGKLTVLKGGTVSASTAALLGKAKGGNLTINATDSVEVSGNLKDDDDGTFFSSLVTETGRLLSLNIGINPALGGNLTINTGKLNISDGGKVSSATYRLAGQAGDLTVNARESIQVSGNQSRLTAKTNSTGNAGDLRIRTQKLVIQKGAEVSTSTSGDNEAFRVRNRGQGGILDVNASDSVKVSGVNSGLVSLSLLSTGDAGKIKINTGRLIIRDGATVSTSSFGRGKGGDLEVNASDFIEISGSGISFINDISSARGVGFEQFTRKSSLSSWTASTKDAGNITINAGQLFIRNGGEVVANTFGFGKGGDVSIQVNSASLENKASISSNSGNEQSNPDAKFGNAGDIFIDVRDRLQSQNSTISTTAATSSGGAINITAKDIRLFDDSDIRTNVFSGAGGGGNITLTANTIVALGDSDILSFARDGKGGDIRFNTEGFFTSSQFLPNSSVTNPDDLDENNRVDVNASGAISGSITGIPDTNFIQNSLTDLPNNQIDPNTLIANSCIARTDNQNNTFFIVGKGGIPIRPDDAPLPNHSTGSIRSLPTEFEKLLSTNNRRPWKIGDPIVEPTGVYKLPNGQLILSRECS